MGFCIPSTNSLTNGLRSKDIKRICVKKKKRNRDLEIIYEAVANERARTEMRRKRVNRFVNLITRFMSAGL